MKKLAYPKTVESRGSTATIYLQKPRSLTRYEIRCYDADGAQQCFTFTTAEATKEFIALVRPQRWQNHWAYRVFCVAI